MRHRIWTLAITLPLSCACEQAQRAPQAPEVSIVCDGEGITVNGVRIAAPCEKRLLISALGPFDRSVRKANDIDTWDRLGIYAYAENSESIYHSLTVTLAEEDYDHSPTTPHAGPVGIGEHTISASTPPASLPSMGFRQDPMLPFLYNYEAGVLTIVAEVSQKDRSVRALGISFRARPDH